MNKLTEKLAHMFLYAGFALGAVAVYFSRFDAQRQFTVLLLMIVFYLIWGFVYHHLKGDATKKLMVEYLIIASIVLVVGVLVLVV